MSSRPFVIAVLISLLLALIPLQQPASSALEEESEVFSTVGSLEDYDLFLGKDSDDSGNDLDLTTIEPEGSDVEQSILNSGISFYTNELLSDLTIYGESGSNARITAIMQFESGNNNESTADVTFKLYTGSDLIRQHTCLLYTSPSPRD